MLPVFYISLVAALTSPQEKVSERLHDKSLVAQNFMWVSFAQDAERVSAGVEFETLIALLKTSEGVFEISQNSRMLKYTPSEGDDDGAEYLFTFNTDGIATTMERITTYAPKITTFKMIDGSVRAVITPVSIPIAGASWRPALTRPLGGEFDIIHIPEKRIWIRKDLGRSGPGDCYSHDFFYANGAFLERQTYHCAGEGG